MKLKLTMLKDLDVQRKLKVEVEGDKMKEALALLMNTDIELEIENRANGKSEMLRGTFSMVEKNDETLLYFELADKI